MRHNPDTAVAGSIPRSVGERELTDESQVLRALRRRETAGLPLNLVAVLRADRALYNAIHRFFDGWDQAMCAAGIDPERVRNHHRWNRQVVIRRILQREAEGRPLNSSAVQRTEKTLAAAARHWFGSWNSALKASGIDPASCSKRVPTWTRQRVVEAIQVIYARGGAVNHAAVRRNSVSRAGVVFFGTWDNALRAAGLDPAAIRRWRKPWTRETLLQEIRRKAQAGEPLNAKDVSPNWIRKRAGILFGSWDATLAAAGLDPATIRQHPWHRRRKGRECISKQ